MIMAGEVSVDGRQITKVGTQVSAKAEIQLKDSLPYVSRGGLKLAPALDVFQVDPTGLVCADVGASTGRIY